MKNTYQATQIKQKPIMKMLFLICFSLFLFIPCFSQEFPKEKNENLRKRLDSLASAYIDEGAIAGFSVAVFQGSDTLLLKGYGKADVGLDVPATSETKYRLVGPSATILAVLLMQQVERGIISLDDDITHHLPEFPWQGRSVTLRQLLNASSGIPDHHYLGDPFLKEIAVPKSYEDVTAIFAGRPFVHEPGERHSWTISGFHLAGVILERITGKNFQELLQENIIKPLGLKNTSYCGVQTIVSDLATGYTSTSGSLMLARPESPTMYPFIVTIFASAGDIATFFQALEDERLISLESWEEIMKAPAGFGMGVFGAEPDGYKAVLSIGALFIGYKSFVQHIPEEELTVVVLENTMGGVRGHPFQFNLGKIVLGLPLQILERQDIKLFLDLPVENDLDSYTRTYRTTFPDGTGTRKQYERTYEIYEENNRLMNPWEKFLNAY